MKAGSFNQLVIHLTSPLDNADDALAGSDFFRTFMMTLQTFSEPELFVSKLIERYDVPACPEGIPSSKNYELDLKHPVQMRVCNVLSVPLLFIHSPTPSRVFVSNLVSFFGFAGKSGL